MRIDSRLIGFGVFFIVFGVVSLGARQNWIPSDLVDRAWQLWPLLLIGVGISIVLRGRAGAEIGGLVVAVTFAVMAAGVLAGGAFPVGCGGDAARGTPFERQSGDLANGARVEVDFSCGELTVDTGDGATWTLEGTSDKGRAPRVDREDNRLHLESAEGGGIFGFSEASASWRLGLPTGPTVDLDLGLNAGSGTVELAGANLSRLDAAVNAGSFRVDLRDIASVGALDVAVNAGSAIVWLPNRALEGKITANAGSVSICAPDDLGLRLLVGDNPISSNDFDSQGLVRVGDGWESPDFATAAVRITLRTEANAGSMSLNPVRDCAG